jgi:hypothetical protein
VGELVEIVSIHIVRLDENALRVESAQIAM